jgi:CHAD domain-containing protein
MPYRLKRKESIADGIRRVAAEQFRGAERDLRAPRRPQVVHSARKRLKMLRAVLRLIRSAVDDDVFVHENQALRDIGRMLSKQRDADVLVEVMGTLAPAGAKTPGFQAVMARVRAERRRMQREMRKTHAIANAHSRLLEAQDRLEAWATDAVGRRALVKGLRRSVKRSIRSGGAARKSQSDVKWHEWRKRTKDLWYHLRLIRGVWPAVLDGAIAQFKQLADELGDDHDLAMTADRLRGFALDGNAKPELIRLGHAIRHRRDELQGKAGERAACLLATSPGAFADHFEAAWLAWRA